MELDRSERLGIRSQRSGNFIAHRKTAAPQGVEDVGIAECGSTPETNARIPHEAGDGVRAEVRGLGENEGAVVEKQAHAVMPVHRPAWGLVSPFLIPGRKSLGT